MVCGDYSQATTVELRSSSFTLTLSSFVTARPITQVCWLSLFQTLGNASELPFLSLNHDLLTVFNIDTLGGRRTELLSSKVV